MREQALIDKVLAAHGGREALTRIRAATIGGTWSLVDGRVYRYEMKLQLPDRLHWEFEQTAGGQERVVNVLNGNRAWVREQGVARELFGTDHGALLDVHFRWTLAMVVGTVFDLCQSVEVAGPSRLGDRASLAVRLAAPGRRELTAHFDPDSGELLGYASLANLPKPGHVGHFSEQQIRLEAVAGEYREFGDYRRMRSLRILKDGHFDRLNDYLSLQLHDAELIGSLFEAP